MPIFFEKTCRAWATEPTIAPTHIDLTTLKSQHHFSGTHRAAVEIEVDVKAGSGAGREDVGHSQQAQIEAWSLLVHKGGGLRGKGILAIFNPEIQTSKP